MGREYLPPAGHFCGDGEMGGGDKKEESHAYKQRESARGGGERGGDASKIAR